jgi:hypothetical protein
MSGAFMLVPRSQFLAGRLEGVFLFSSPPDRSAKLSDKNLCAPSSDTGYHFYKYHIIFVVFSFSFPSPIKAKNTAAPYIQAYRGRSRRTCGPKFHFSGGKNAVS